MATEDIKVGISATSTTKVCKENCASLMGSGALDVFATPAVVAYMEMAACYAVNGLLEEGLSTVGTPHRRDHHRNSHTQGDRRPPSGLRRDRPGLQGRDSERHPRALHHQGGQVPG